MTEEASADRRNAHVVISTRAVRSSAGSSRIVLALTRGYAAAGHRVDVIADRLAADAVAGAGGHPRYPLRFAWLQGLGRRLLSRQRQLALRERAVRRGHPDLVIADGDLARQDVVILHNVIRREVEALGVESTADQAAAAAAQERALGGNDYRLVVVNSELSRREAARCLGLDPARSVVVRPGHDPAQFSATERPALREVARRELGVGPADVVVAFVASGHFVLRGVAVLAATLARLPAPTLTRIRLLAVGREHNVELLRATLAKAGAHVAVIARPRSPKVENYYHAADLLFHPALFETFGLVVMEAAACGTPVLTSAAVGATELFTGPGALAVATRPEPALFAPLLERLVTEPEFARDVAGSQQRAVAPRTWPAYAAEFMAATAALLPAGSGA